MDKPETQSIKPIAFYLPQFHCIPENDAAYGPGFTEWVNVKKAKPLFEGHYQPRIPENAQYYSLLDINVMIRQAQLARENHIYGFCYYHYWFKNGKKLLEKPIEAMLRDKRVDIPFCLCWANENWSKRWDGGNNEIIVEQDYGDEREWDEHLRYLADYFLDERYIRIDNEPLLLIYKPELMDNCSKWVQHIRKKIKEYGFTGIKIAVQYPKYYLNNYDRNLFDYYIVFEPAYTRIEEEVQSRSRLTSTLYSVLKNTAIKPLLTKIYTMRNRSSEPKLEHRDYEKDWNRIVSRDYSDEKMILGGFVDWDNTPRNQNGLVYDGVTPEKFKTFFRLLCEKVKTRKERFIFINAWNEWAEGAYLEHDEKYKGAFLHAIKDVTEENDTQLYQQKNQK